MIEAAYYDGQTARRHPVRLLLSPGHLRILGDGIDWNVPLDGVHISERLGSAPRLLSFANGAYCETRDHAGFERALAAIGYRHTAVDRAQRSGSMALLALALLVAAALVAYFWGLPLLARAVAQAMPPSARVALSEQTLQFLDGALLQPSALPEARRQQIEARFAALQVRGGVPPGAHLLFRSSPHLGPNAFALPDGTLVLLDALVKLADNDEQILGVLAHELGHVEYQHGLQQIVHSTLVGALSAWWFGDISGLLAAAPATLLDARNSRAFERQADAFGAQLMRANGLSPRRLAEMLEKLVVASGERAGHASGIDSFLSSHPATAERIEALRQD